MRKYKFHGEKLVFKEGLAPFRDGYENRIGFVDIHGYIIIKPAYKRIGHLYPGFRDGLCKASYRKRWGFINKNGEWVIPPIYNDVQSYSEGVAAVVQGNKVKYVDTFGDKIFEKVFFSRLSYVNLTLFSGDFVIEPTLRRAFSFADDVAQVEIDGKWGLINTKVEMIAGF